MHKAEAILVTCIDFRLQEAINKWTVKHLQPGSFDRVAFAGGVQNLEIILGQIDISVRLHQIEKVVLINHEDCGAYGAEGTLEQHAKDLKNASARIKKQYPNLEVETFYLYLDGTLEPI